MLEIGQVIFSNVARVVVMIVNVYKRFTLISFEVVLPLTGINLAKQGAVLVTSRLHGNYILPHHRPEIGLAASIVDGFVYGACCLTIN
jgi:hypothetical protein